MLLIVAVFIHVLFLREEQYIAIYCNIEKILQYESLRGAWFEGSSCLGYDFDEEWWIVPTNRLRLQTSDGVAG